jgi:hypothetical protein
MVCVGDFKQNLNIVELLVHPDVFISTTGVLLAAIDVS